MDMTLRNRFHWRELGRSWLALLLVLGSGHRLSAEPIVPGTGTRAVQVGDDFEEEDWEFIPNLPKSSKNINKFEGGAGGYSKNARWYEGVKRGQPDLIKRVPTPKGGLSGSQGALLLRSLYTGIPRYPSYGLQQDDYICDVEYRLGGTIPIWQCPNVVVRVYFPPVAQWEQRTGPHFALRTAVDLKGWTTNDGELPRPVWGREIYYPGMFVEFECKKDTGREYDSAYLRIRADRNGTDYKGPEITTTGWWTLGISFSPDGAVHYYAKPGIEDLTENDRIASNFPYGYRAERFKTFFFNVCNGDDGRTWSTPFVVDDAFVYWITPEQRKELAKTPAKSGTPKLR